MRLRASQHRYYDIVLTTLQDHVFGRWLTANSANRYRYIFSVYSVVEGVPVDRQRRHMYDAHVQRGPDEIGRAQLCPACQPNLLESYIAHCRLGIIGT
jgi:hypothetical protein